ncbi:ATPase [Novosphingopyxis sp.]|uniref:F0F1 ATP synthase subunit B family protein n=1 Tax=Novosphingopyxis sp. TaxID=2709690 RepID=UPI003B5BAE14
MPQFEFDTVLIPQLFWLGIFFAILYFGVVRLTLPKLGRVMEHREDKVNGDIDAAAAAKQSADQLEADYKAGIAKARDDARVALADAKTEAGRTTEARLAEATRASDVEIEAAEGRIAEARAAAMQEIETVATESAVSIVDRITGKAPPEAKARGAAKAALAGGAS